MQDTAISSEQIKAFLQQYSDDARNLAVMQERLSTLEAKSGSTGTSKLTGMPRGPGDPVDTIGRQVTALDTLRDAVTAAEAQLFQRRQRTETIIDILREQRVTKWPEKVNTLQLRYIDGLAWDDAAEVLFGADPEFWDAPERYRARMMTYHRQALQELSQLCPPELLDVYD